VRKGRRLLLDTHCFLWWKTDEARLTEATRVAIAEADLVFVSAASAWEVAIKARLGSAALSWTRITPLVSWRVASKGS
jgi:PIN domain nuclease of toxin-antitoxin system